MVKLNDAGRRNLAAIMSGAAREIAQQRGWTNQREMAVRSLPDLTLRNVFVVGEGGLDRADGERLWRELGDGAYLATFTEIATGREMQVGVMVRDGMATMTPMSEEQAAALPGAMQALMAGERPGGVTPPDTVSAIDTPST